MGVALLVVAGLVLVAVFAYVSWLQAKKRRELFASFAASQGWTWRAREDSWSNRFDGTPFDEGDHKQARNILQGSFRNRPIVAFDYSYQTHSTDSKGNRQTQTHRFAVCALSVDAYLPRLELVPESVLGRFGTALGMQDIELESEDFNRRYRVRAGNQKFAFDVLPPRTMEALMRRSALHLRLSGTDAVCWEPGRHSPSELLARLDALATLVEGIPEFVWKDLKGSPQ